MMDEGIGNLVNAVVLEFIENDNRRNKSGRLAVLVFLLLLVFVFCGIGIDVGSEGLCEEERE